MIVYKLLSNRKLVLFVFLLLFTAGLTFLILSIWDNYTFSPRMSGYEVHGIDVSHYQNDINWNRVKADSVRFVFMKATEGDNFLDPNFRKNWRSAKQKRLFRGAYHFYRPSIRSDIQAKHFIRVVDLSSGDFPPVLDLEVTDNRPKHIVLKGVKNWLSIIEGHYGVKPIIYTNLDWYKKYVKDNFKGYVIWIAAYRKYPAPDLSDGKKWHFWQYTNRGKIKGIKGHVDMNVFEGSETDLKLILLP